MEKINLKYQYEQNDKAVKNLQNQVDFLNRENDQLQRQVEILKGDGEGNLALSQFTTLKQEIESLTKLNDRLQKDFSESNLLLR